MSLHNNHEVSQARLNLQQSYLFDLLRSRAHDPARIFAEHRRFAREFESHVQPHTTFPNVVDPHRRLRIGYVSADFRRHSVAYFIEPIIAHHDRTAVEVFCYYSCPQGDDVTRRIEAAADQWVPCAELSHQALADRIRADRIDVLVDLAGHTTGGRLPAFALKPAPIQISYLGYPATTGFTAMDYRITDHLADPEGLSDAFYTEKPLRNPTMMVYRPAFGAGGLLGETELPVHPAPVLEQGYVTFGSCNHVSKINDSVVEIWARIVAAVPGSKLLLKSRDLDNPDRHAALRAMFSMHGVGAERLQLLSRDEGPMEHLNRYARIDVGLDPFPYNGVTTSFEAMWMGVPFVTLAGNTLASRAGVTIATNVGHPEWIAHTPAQYIERAVQLASDPQRLNNLRSNLRQQLRESSLMDGHRFTRNLEASYRHVWREWCASRRGVAQETSRSASLELTRPQE